jgi:protein required for attachment to host cells
VKQPRTWLLVADGGSANVYSNTGNTRPHEALLQPVTGGRFRRERDRPDFSSPPTRSYTGPLSSAPHGVTGQEDKKRDEEESFLLDVLSWLVAPSNLPQFDRLIVAAPPRALGELRAAMPRKLADKLSHEIHADLTKAPIKEIERRVSDHLFSL